MREVRVEHELSELVAHKARVADSETRYELRTGHFSCTLPQASA
ncbi:hypothetical protein ACFSWE_06435 [Leucobacter albus]|uniref:Uncharacterized protein n=1 Tax=Leucobacter albus TaxID=272210 RepID=A0ABW3TIZ2_9MICO